MIPEALYTKEWGPLLIARRGTPIVMPGVHVREKYTGLRRHGRVYMNIDN